MRCHTASKALLDVPTYSSGGPNGMSRCVAPSCAAAATPRWLSGQVWCSPLSSQVRVEEAMVAADGLTRPPRQRGTRSCFPSCSPRAAPRSATQIPPTQWTPWDGAW